MLRNSTGIIGEFGARLDGVSEQGGSEGAERAEAKDPDRFQVFEAGGFSGCLFQVLPYLSDQLFHFLRRCQHFAGPEHGPVFGEIGCQELRAFAEPGVFGVFQVQVSFKVVADDPGHAGPEPVEVIGERLSLDLFRLFQSELGMNEPGLFKGVPFLKRYVFQKPLLLLEPVVERGSGERRVKRELAERGPARDVVLDVLKNVLPGVEVHEQD